MCLCSIHVAVHSFTVQTSGDTLRISNLRELVAANTDYFRSESQAALTNGQRNVEVDLSETVFVDSSGLGALVTLYKLASRRSGKVTLLHPQPPVRQMLELTRLDRVFEVVSP